MTETVDIPERVAAGRTLAQEHQPHHTGRQRYRATVSQILRCTEEPSQVCESALKALEEHQGEFIAATLTHPYAVEVLTGAQAPAEYLEAGRALMRAPERAERAALVQVLADILHAAEADGHEPAEVTATAR